jgi:hypothetical protein
MSQLPFMALFGPRARGRRCRLAGVKRTLFGLVPTPLLTDAVEKGHTDFVLDSIRNLFQVRISSQGSLV